MRDFFRDRHINKEWLSLHQCIDENCRVHHNLNTDHVTINGNLGGHKNIHITHESDPRHKYGNSKQSANLVDAERDGDESSKSNIIDLIHKSGGFTMIAECYEENSPENSSTKVEQASQSNSGKCEHGKRHDIVKPRFMCSWLRKNTDINKFPFYKLAVKYDSEKSLKKDASAYPIHVTDHIWAKHKYIGDEVNDTKTHFGVRDATSSASRSHENLSRSVETVIKDIPDIDISDLKQKYSFLFNPNYTTISTNNGTRNCDGLSKYLETRKGLHYADYVAKTNNTGTEAIIKDNTLIRGADDKNLYCENDMDTCSYTTKKQENDKQNISVVHYENYNYNKSNSSSDYHTMQSEYDRSLNIHPASFVQVETYENSSKLTRDSYLSKYHTSHYQSTTHTVWPDCVTEPSPLGSNKLDQPFNLHNSSCVNMQDYSSPKSICNGQIWHSTSIATAQSENDSVVGNKQQQLQAVYSKCDPCEAEMTYCNASPLVCSEAFSHYASPMRYYSSPFATCTRNYFTKRNKDPRIKVDVENNTLKARGRNQNVVKSDDSHLLLDSPVPSKCVHNLELNCVNGHNAHVHQFHESQAEIEDPLQGKVGHEDYVKQYESYAESPDSEIFYNLNINQNGEPHHDDDVMDLFYGEKSSPESSTPIVYENSLDFRYDCHSPRTSQYNENRSRSRRYRTGINERSRSREIFYEYRRSRSRSAEVSLRHVSKQARHSITPCKRRLSRGLSQERFKRENYSYEYRKRKMENDKVPKHKSSERHRYQSNERSANKTSRSPIFNDSQRGRERKSDRDRKTEKDRSPPVKMRKHSRRVDISRPDFHFKCDRNRSFGLRCKSSGGETRRPKRSSYR